MELLADAGDYVVLAVPAAVVLAALGIVGYVVKKRTAARSGRATRRGPSEPRA